MRLKAEKLPSVALQHGLQKSGLGLHDFVNLQPSTLRPPPSALRPRPSALPPSDPPTLRPPTLRPSALTPSTLRPHPSSPACVTSVCN